MKKTLLTATALAFGLAATVNGAYGADDKKTGDAQKPAGAQQTTDTQKSGDTKQTTDTQKSADVKQRQAWTQSSDAMESSRLIGMRVRTSDNKDAGEIDQLIVSKDGKVTHAVIGKGGFAGVGETKVVVAWDQLQFQSASRDGGGAASPGAGRPATAARPGDDRMVAMIEKSALDSAPRYDKKNGVAPAASPATDPKTDKSTTDKKQ